MLFRLASLAIGYLFGIFQTAYFCGKMKGIDIREHGSGNAGTTNTLRVLGFKMALLVFLGDFLKSIAAVTVVKFVFKDMATDILPLLGIYAGAGAVLGHNFPVQLGFRGGKGIACTGGLIVAMDPHIALVAIASFLIIVAVTRYVSLASIVLVIEFFTLLIYYGGKGVYGMMQGSRMEMYAVAAFLMVMAIYQHRANIVRLIHGQENKLSFSKKKKFKQVGSMAEIGVVGAGSWGTALALVLERNGHHVTLWSSREEKAQELRTLRENTDKLPGVKLPDSMEITADMEAAVKDKDLVVLGVPSPYIRSTAAKMAPFVHEGQIIVNVSKGIEESTLDTMTDIIAEELPGTDVAVLAGPSHAEEVSRGIPTTVVAGAKTRRTAETIQNLFMNEVFRVYTSPDMLGIEIGSALKNVIALAAGIADGLGCGDNTKAALITRGIAEMSRLGVTMGGHQETFNGLTGIGDLIVTCASRHSRNRKAGYLIGQGYKMQEAMAEVKMVVEGVNSAKAALKLAEKYYVRLPIIEQVNEVLFDDKPAEEALKDLMLRDKKIENPLLPWDK